MKTKTLLMAMVFLGHGIVSHASDTQMLLFSSVNSTHLTGSNYGVLVLNDRFGPEFIRQLNLSINSSFKVTQNAPRSIWDMLILTHRETREAPHFFVSDHNRASAQRFLGYFQGINFRIDSKERKRLIELFESSDRAVPAEPAILASRTINQFFYFLFIFPASFIFYQIPWFGLLTRRSVHENHNDPFSAHFVAGSSARGGR